MSTLSVISTVLLVMELTANCNCAPDVYSFSGTFGLESHLNLTGRGYGTLRQKDTGVAGDVDGFIGAKWNGTAYGGAVVGHNDNYIGGSGSVSKVVEGALRPGATFEAGLDGSGIAPRLGIDKASRTTYDARIVTGDNAKRLAQSYGADVQLNSVGTLRFASASDIFCIAAMIISMRLYL